VASNLETKPSLPGFGFPPPDALGTA